MAPLTSLTGIVAQQDSSSSTQSQQDIPSSQYSPDEQQQSVRFHRSPSSPRPHQTVQSSSSSSHLTDSLVPSQQSSQQSTHNLMEQKDEAVPSQMPYFQQSSPLQQLTSVQSDMPQEFQPTYQQLQPLTLEQQQPAQQNHDSSMSTGQKLFNVCYCLKWLIWC